jgi:hypothetical protein
MKTSWVKGLNEEKKKEVEREFNESAFFRKLLSELLQEKLKTKHNESRSKESYESPNWVYFQADCIGYERAITEILSLIES